MSDSSLLKKLRLLPGQRALALNPPSGYVNRLSPLPEGVSLNVADDDAGIGSYDFVHLFVQNSADLARLALIAQAACRYDGALWISYPKLTAKVASDLSRDRLWELMKPTGLAPVTQIAIDDTWSALRFRPAERVGAGKG